MTLHSTRAARLRRLTLAVSATTVLALASLDPCPARAEPPPAEQPADASPKVQFVDMGEMLIDGETVKPMALAFDARARVRFERLFRLQKPVLPRLRQTARDVALR